MLNATYTPGTAYIAEGYVELCLTAEPCGSCTTPATDCMVLSIVICDQVELR